MNASKIAIALGHAEHRGRKWRCDCPLHGGNSLELADGEVGLLVYCWGGCDVKAILAELRNRGLLDDRQSTERRAQCTAPKKTDTAADEEVRIKKAREIWASGIDIAGTAASHYLRARGLPNFTNPSLRFVPDFHYAPGTYLPAMVAGVASPEKKIIGVQVTALSEDGLRKAAVTTPRRTYGVLRDGAVRLAAVDGVIGLAEGTETALSAAEIFALPVWSVLGAKRLDRIAIPSTVGKIIIFGDNDDAGRDAAQRARTAYACVGREIELKFSPDGLKDWNDVLRAQVGGVAA